MMKTMIMIMKIENHVVYLNLLIVNVYCFNNNSYIYTVYLYN
jgi:hypothetical protein